MRVRSRNSFISVSSVKCALFSSQHWVNCRRLFVVKSVTLQNLTFFKTNFNEVLFSYLL